ncbi:MAG TPA: multicopper oxidase domain-containing protein [Thermoanaerobaculia bacterium]|nr:multicopper oxidase domain-containing protein [Thermoanaerobaculia bacterium]
MRSRLSLCVPSLVIATAMLLPLAAAGQTCGNVKEGEELKNPFEITPSGGTLSTTLDVRLATFCIPSKSNGDGTWTTAPMTLRTYMYPGRPTPLVFGPGPTLRLRKEVGATPGNGLRILLKNSLPFPDSNACESACSAGTTCDCSTSAVNALIAECAKSGVNPQPAGCCCIVNCTQKLPNCLHDGNVTNLHFHGSHVSPQSPQDYVLLDLYPPKPAGAPAAVHSEHGALGDVAYGQFEYVIRQFPWNQPEGSHWYHPHRHGSASLQIANGLAGALLIEGPFDDELAKYYNPKTSDKVMVIQSVAEDAPLFTPGAGAGQILVNGQVKPKITGAPGEVQRWRFINATMSSRTLINVTIPAGLTFRQVEMDGIRFSPINYECQPLLNFNPNKPAFPCNPNPGGNPTIRLAPGNRADFLVQFPLVETKKGTEGLRVERKLINITGDTPDQERAQRKLLMQRDEELAPGPAEPALFTVVVDDGIEGNDDQPKMLKAGAPQLPTTLSPMPDYLKELKTVDGKVPLTFQQFVVGRTSPWPYATSSFTQFKLDNRQFDPDCANITTNLGKTYEWTVTNDTTIPHPFHIHTNPFQLWSVKGVPVRPEGATKPEPIWMDTLTLPTATANPTNPPTDLNTPVTITPASFVMRQSYENFTGLYVLHCHFLGHEDRGMMFSVQTICSPGTPGAGKYSHPTTDPNGECIAGAPFFGPTRSCP